MSLAGFITTLYHEGVARVPVIRDASALRSEPGAEASTVFSEDELAAGVDALVSCERLVRADWPSSPPPFDPRVAVSTAAFLFDAARLVLSRQVPEEVADSLLSARRIDGASASAHYSVDVLGRYLPDLFLLAGGPLSDDPVVRHLKRFGADWPLSSVGLADVKVDEARVEVVLNDDALRGAYIDRVLGRVDLGRLRHEPVAEAARLAIGPHTGWVAASISAVLWPSETDLAYHQSSAGSKPGVTP